MDAVLAFAAALVSLRLSADLAQRARSTRNRAFAAWTVALVAFAGASGALAWGAAWGWSAPLFRVYYLFGALLSAALLGAGSLLLVGRKRVTAVALVYSGLALGVVLAMPLHGDLSGTSVPEAQNVLDLWPARVLALVGNSLGTVAVAGVAIATFRRRPLGNTFVLAGLAVAAIGTALAGLGVGALAPALAISSVLLYAGFVVPTRPGP